MEKQKPKSEHSEQVLVIKFWDQYSLENKLPREALFAIPNGGRRSGRNGFAMVAEGLRKGVPDLFLAIPKHPYSGLFIEMKRTKGGIVSDEQKKYIAILSGLGYKSIVAYGAEQAIGAIRFYLGDSGECHDNQSGE